MVAHGVDTVILRVFHNPGDRTYRVAGRQQPSGGYGVYFTTEHAPVIYDLLGLVLPMAHARGLKVFAWMTSKYASYHQVRTGGRLSLAFDLESETVIPGRGLDLFDRDVVAYLADLYEDLCAYELDGILFQDDLVQRHTEGFSPAAIAAYRREFGVPPDPKAMFLDRYRDEQGALRVGRYGAPFWIWARWKSRIMLDLVEKLGGRCREPNPELQVALNLMYEAVLSPDNALAWLAQDLQEARKRRIDLFSIMSYHRQMERELGLTPERVRWLLRRMARQAVRLIGRPEQILFKVQVRDWETQEVLPSTEVAEVLAALRNEAPIGLALVPFGAGISNEVLATLGDEDNGR